MATQSTVNPILLRMERLKLLRELELTAKGNETIYDRLTELASRIIGAPISLMSMVASDRQVFKSAFGLQGWAAEDGETPLSHSFCQYVVTTNKPMVVSDARNDDLLKDNLAIRDLNVIGYLGIPITLMDGQRLGSFCVIDNEPRDWAYVEIALMQELAEILIREIDLKARTRLAPEEHADDLARAQEKINLLIDKLDVNEDKDDILLHLRALREEMKI